MVLSGTYHAQIFLPQYIHVHLLLGSLYLHIMPGASNVDVILKDRKKSHLMITVLDLKKHCFEHVERQ